MQHQIASGLLQLCAVSRHQPCEDAALVGQLVDLGAVPPLLRMRSLSYPRPLREGARRALRPLVRLRGDDVRAVAGEIHIPQPRGTSPAEWLAWRAELEEDLRF